jgi:hypothetical protein
VRNKSYIPYLKLQASILEFSAQTGDTVNAQRAKTRKDRRACLIIRDIRVLNLTRV